MWRYVLKAGKPKPDKVPFQTNGRPAKTNDNSTWTTFEACHAAYDHGGFDGIGFVFDGDIGDDELCYVGADFDRCIENGKLVEPARSRIASLQTYTEISVSGTGVHCILRAKPGTTIAHKRAESGHSVEIYSGGRFFTFTGAPDGETCGIIRAAVAELDALLAEAGAQRESNPPAAKPTELPPGGPAKLFRESREKFESLAEGLDATIEEIRNAAAFYSSYLDEHPQALAGESDWMNLARSFAHQAWRRPEQREELEQILDEISRKAPGYNKEDNAQRFERYVAEASKRPTTGGVGGAKTISSFLAQMRELGWKGYVPTDVAWDVPGYEATNRQLIQQQIIADPEMFSRNGLLVRLRVPETDDLVEGTEWKGDMPGTVVAKTADVMLCAERLVWMKNGKQGPYRVHPPRPFINDYIPQVGGQGARPLRGLTRLPHIDNNGNIRCFVGYDPRTRLYNDKPIKLDIQPMLSRDEARRLVDKLFHPFSLYRFEDPKAGCATILAALFTILERPYLPLAPMFIFRCAMAGTGKGKLAQALTELALATTPVKMTWGGSAEEFEKRLTGLLLRTPSAISIDNANGVMIKSALLESIITEGYDDVRVLGYSDMIRVYHRASLMLTGCNPIITGDMARRALAIDIAPKSADPERDRYAFDPVKYVQQHRKELLEAAFSIMRAFRQAGMPQDPRLPEAGSFEEWSRRVRDLVYWLTDYDVAEGFHLNKAEDPHRQNDVALLEALYNHYGGKSFTSASVIELYEWVKSEIRTDRRVADPHLTPIYRAVYYAQTSTRRSSATGRGTSWGHTTATLYCGGDGFHCGLGPKIWQ
jgi:hypothetical protein